CTTHYQTIIFQNFSVTIGIYIAVQAVFANAGKFFHIKCSDRVTIQVTVDSCTCLTGPLSGTCGKNSVRRVYNLIIIESDIISNIVEVTLLTAAFVVQRKLNSVVFDFHYADNRTISSGRLNWVSHYHFQQNIFRLFIEVINSTGKYFFKQTKVKPYVTLSRNHP